MSDYENFLSRWSRRKREELRDSGAAVPPPETPRGKPAEKDCASAEDSAQSAPASAVSTFDPASLASIESITAETDIRGFLTSGVPAELTRAALRRAWACDPAIRNFVGLADYDWDFNAANSITGFGPLPTTDEVGKIAANMLKPNSSELGGGNRLDSAPTIPTAEQIAADEADFVPALGAAGEMHDHETSTPPHHNELTYREDEHAGGQYTAMKPDSGGVRGRRQHGGALPK
jgi:hypothetical protein